MNGLPLMAFNGAGLPERQREQFLGEVRPLCEDDRIFALA